MAFKLIKPPTDGQIIFVNINATAVAIGDLLFNAIGSTAWSNSVGGVTSIENWHKKCVAAQANTAGTDTSDLKCILVNPTDQWEASVTNNSSVNHDGDRMVLTSSGEVNNTGTDSASVSAVFIQRHIIGAASDKRVIGEIVFGSGVDPDAT